VAACWCNAGLSNGRLQQWPKVERGVARFRELVQQAHLQRQGLGQPEGLQEQDGAPGPGSCVDVELRHSAECGEHAAGQQQQQQQQGHSAAAQPGNAAAAAASGPQGPHPAQGPGSSAGPGAAAPPAAARRSREGRCGADVPWGLIFRRIMGDTARVEDLTQLPDTGCPQDLELLLSPAFIEECTLLDQPYGTRSQTVLAVWRDGRAELRERSRPEGGGGWSMVRHEFHVQL
jgi:hypothetical protein